MSTNEDAGRGKRTAPTTRPPKYEVGESLDFEAFVDGVASTMFGANVSKVTFYTFDTLAATRDDDESAPPNRKIRGQLIIPTTSLIRFCLKTLESVAKNKDKLDVSDNHKKLIEQIEKLIK